MAYSDLFLLPLRQSERLTDRLVLMCIMHHARIEEFENLPPKLSIFFVMQASPVSQVDIRAQAGGNSFASLMHTASGTVIV